MAERSGGLVVGAIGFHHKCRPPISRTSPSVISHSPRTGPILDSAPMPYFPPPPPVRRAPRTGFEETTPAVLRCQDGRRLRGKREVISLTGGLLWLSKPLNRGAQVKLMFLTRRGSVLGAAEMLSPVTWGLQPFKFVRLYDDGRAQAASGYSVVPR